MVDIEAKLVRRIMLLSHERGIEMSREEVLARAKKLAASLCDKGMPADKVYALELMIQLLGSTHGN